MIVSEADSNLPKVAGALELGGPCSNGDYSRQEQRDQHHGDREN
jgi:hypothetical protein